MSFCFLTLFKITPQHLFAVVSVYQVLCFAPFDNNVTPSCSKEESICEFHWLINYTETMVLFHDSDDDGTPIVYKNGTMYKRLDCDEYVEATKEEVLNSLTGDGTYRILYTVNGKFPGPSIVVYEGQQVVIHVVNGLLMEGVTIHWHGIYQRGTPFMDGVDMVTQCPISPGQSFTYRFIAEPSGTHWYHSHLGVQRTDGLAGALIVLPREDETLENEEEVVEKEMVVMIQDWVSISSTKLLEHFIWDLRRFAYGADNPRCFFASDIHKSDGGLAGFMLFKAGVVNGRGHQYSDFGDEPDLPLLPYEIFKVESNKTYRFRLINTGNAFTLQISIDQHELELIATDGRSIKGVKTDFITTTPGERIDFLLRTSEKPGNYWFRVDANGGGQVKAIVRYDNVKEDLPITVKKRCTPSNPCRDINCMVIVFPPSYDVQCLPMSSLTSTKKEQESIPLDTERLNFKEIFLSVHFQSETDIAEISGFSFLKPTSPLQTYPNMEDAAVACDRTDLHCSDEVCYCTNIIKVDLGSTVQFVFVNPGPHVDDVELGLQHPMHIHGHTFHVLKVAHSEYDLSTGESIGINKDIECDTNLCNNPSWANKSWGGNDIPGLNLVDPPIKDTVLVPRHGYTVIRMTANNPGFWFLHCHIEIHQMVGMALILQVGNIEQMPPIPKNFPTCSNFHFSEKEFEEILQRGDSKTSNLQSNLKAPPQLLSAEVQDTVEETAHCLTNVVSEESYIVIICLLVIIVIGAVTFSIWQYQEKLHYAKRHKDNAKYVLLNAANGTENVAMTPVNYNTFSKL